MQGHDLPVSENQKHQEAQSAAPLVEVTRGAITESRHRGHVIAVDGDGNTVAYLGAPETVTYLRSSAKPHQAIPLIASGAADPLVLPLGTRVRVDAGQYSGEYVVADTGGAVRGKRIDIWTPNSREAMRFGRRTVKLTVLSYGPKHSRAKLQAHR